MVKAGGLIPDDTWVTVTRTIRRKRSEAAKDAVRQQSKASNERLE